MPNHEDPDFETFRWAGQLRYRCPLKRENGQPCGYDTYDRKAMEDHVRFPCTTHVLPAGAPTPPVTTIDAKAKARLADQTPAHDALIAEHKIESLAAHQPDVHASSLEERKALYAEYKRDCQHAGVHMNEKKLAQLASPGWNTRDPIMKWKAGKDRPGDDNLIRRAIRKGPPVGKA